MKNLVYILIAAIVIFGGIMLFGGDGSPAPDANNQQATTTMDNQNTPAATSTDQQSTTTDQANNTQANASPTGDQNVIVYTDEGYSPKTITIQQGETVTWRNESSRGMWTASAIHPTHGIYPTGNGCIGSTFDSCKDIPSGESWSFTFEESGEWGYHNHTYPADTGTVIVE